MSAVIGGAIGVVTTEFVSAAEPNNDLVQAMEKTEEILDALGERTNLLDINQRRILILLEETKNELNI